MSLGAMFSKWISGGVKSFGMTFGSQLATGGGKGFVDPVTKPGVQGLAQAYLATKKGQGKSFSETMADMQSTVVNPTAASVSGGRTTPNVSVRDVSQVGISNPDIARALRQTLQRNVQIDPHFDRILRELYKEGNTQVAATLQSGKLTQKA